MRSLAMMPRLSHTQLAAVIPASRTCTGVRKLRILENQSNHTRNMSGTCSVWKSSIPRISANCSDCSCPMCHLAHYNPIGMEGTKEIISNPVIKPDSDKMHCETQPPVSGRGQGSCQGICIICGQVTGPGLCHPCSHGDVQALR